MSDEQQDLYVINQATLTGITIAAVQQSVRLWAKIKHTLQCLPRRFRVVCQNCPEDFPTLIFIGELEKGGGARRGRRRRRDNT